jgi:anti-anti-sigma factor
MQRHQHDPAPLWAIPGSVEIGHHAPHLALVAVRGEHDISTQPTLEWALECATAQSDVLVDLSECTFMDSTVIRLLIKAAHRVQARGGQIALVIPPAPAQVARVAAMVQLGDIIPLHAAYDAGIASLEQRPSRRAPSEQLA